MENNLKQFEYKEIVGQETPVLLLAPGIFEINGGMFNYMTLWLTEIKKFTSKYFLLLDEKFREVPLEGHVVFQDILTESKSKALFIAVMARLFPSSWIKYFFVDYKEMVGEYNSVHILTSFLLAYPLISSLFHFNNDLTIILTLHDPVPHEEKIAPLAKKIKRYYLKKLYELSRIHPGFYLHIHSQILVEECKDVAGKVIVYPHPLPKPLVTPKREAFNGTIFGVLGRMEAYKGLDILYHAMATLNTDPTISKKIRLLLVGSGNVNTMPWENLQIEVIIDNKRVTEQEFHQYISGIDCLLLPYKKASQSGVGYLALTYDIPIIATNTGGLPEIVEQSNDERSTVISPNDVNELREAIIRFTNSAKIPKRDK